MLQFLLYSLVAIIVAGVVCQVWKKRPRLAYDFFAASVGMWCIIAFKTIPTPIPFWLGAAVGVFWGLVYLIVRRFAGDRESDQGLHCRIP